MSIAGIASSALMHYTGQTAQSNRQKWQQSMQQLGQDLQSGNLSAAQTDFASLQQMSPQASSTASTQSTGSVAQDFTQLGKDLQASNTSAAQQDYAQLQHDVSPTAASAAHHHHHHGGDDGGTQVSQMLQDLGQQLQAGNLSGAQQAYTVLQQQLELFGQTDPTSSTSGSVAVNA